MRNRGNRERERERDREREREREGGVWKRSRHLRGKGQRLTKRDLTNTSVARDLVRLHGTVSPSGRTSSHNVEGMVHFSSAADMRSIRVM